MLEAQLKITPPEDLVKLLNHDSFQEEKILARFARKVPFSQEEHAIRIEFLEKALGEIQDPAHPEHLHILTLLAIHQLLSPSQDKAIVDKAVSNLHKAVAQKNALAECALGDCYFLGKGVPKDFKLAVKHYEASSQQGYAIGTFSLGMCYGGGNGVKKNTAMAETLIRQAILKGSTAAMVIAGQTLLYGAGDESVQAIALLERAHAAGNTDATYMLAQQAANYEQTHSEEKYLALLLTACADGNPHAMFDLAIFYREDTQYKDDRQALDLLQKLDAAGYEKATHVLASLHMNGRGVARNFAKAFELYIRCCQLEKPEKNPDALQSPGDLMNRFSPHYLMSMFERLDELSEEQRNDIMDQLPALARCCAKACKDFPNSDISKYAIQILSWWRRKTENTEMHYWASLILGYTLDTLYARTTGPDLISMYTGFFDDGVLKLEQGLKKTEDDLIADMIKQDPHGFMDCLLKDDVIYKTTEQKIAIYEKHKDLFTGREAFLIATHCNTFNFAASYLSLFPAGSLEGFKNSLRRDRALERVALRPVPRMFE